MEDNKPKCTDQEIIESLQTFDLLVDGACDAINEILKSVTDVNDAQSALRDYWVTCLCMLKVMSDTLMTAEDEQSKKCLEYMELVQGYVRSFGAHATMQREREENIPIFDATDKDLTN